MNGGLTAVARRGERGMVLGAILMATTAMGWSAATPAAAQTASAARHGFDVPAQPLAQALMIFGRQSGLQVTAEGPLTSGLTSTAIKGDFVPAEALSRLLAGTGLTYRFVGNNGVQIERAPQISDGAMQLGPVRVEGASGPGGFASSDIGRTEGGNSYTGRATTVNSRVPQTLRETPQSVTVVTRDRIEDQNLFTLADALGQTTGITVVTGADSLNAQFLSRGFDIDVVQYDGVATTERSDYQGAPGTMPDLALFDRVEVLRGAAGLLQGSGNPGAAVNLVRKRPTSEFQASAMASIGTWNSYRVEGDISGPLNGDGSLRARAIGVFEDKDYFIDEVGLNKKLGSLLVEYEFTPRTRILVGGRIQQVDDTPNFVGLPFNRDGTPPALGRSTFLGSSWNHSDRSEWDVFGELEHRFSDDWSLKVTANHLRSSLKQKYAMATAFTPTFGIGLAPDDYLMPLNASYFDNIRNRQTGGEAVLTGKVRAFGQEHDIVLGANARRDWLDSGGFGADLWPWRSIFIDPYTWNPSSIPEPQALPSPSRTFTTTPQSAVFGMARIRPVANLSLILGGRFSDWKTKIRNVSLPSGNVTSERKIKVDTEFTPYGGIVWDVSRDLSVYASYADIFQPQSVYDRNGNVLPPIVGANYEAGLKGEFAGGRLNASLAIFRIDQTNRPQTDLTGPSPCPVSGAFYCSYAQGKVRSEGFEAELSGALTDNLEVVAGYTYNKTKYAKDPNNQGNVFSTVTPEHILKLWANYRLPGAAERWQIGAGLNYQSSFYVISEGLTITQDGYALARARIAYRFAERAELAVNVNNLFDKTYWARLGGPISNNFYGEPRSITASVRARF